MRKTLSVLTIGEELLDGRICDTNAQFLSAAFYRAGFDIRAHLSCGDKVDEIVNALQFLSKQSEIVITSGGLGPTSDDLTRDAMAKLLGVNLVCDNGVLENLKQRFAKRNREFSENNKRQAYIPEGSSSVHNPVGTAPGFVSAYRESNGKETTIASLPGVPSELRAMLEEGLLERLTTGCTAVPERRAITLRLFGLPESQVGKIIDSLGLDKRITVSYRPSFPEVKLQLLTEDPQLDLEAAQEHITQALGREFVYSFDPTTSFDQALHSLLAEKNITISTAESCSGGLVGKLLTNSPGSSAYYLGGVVSYSNQAKEKLLGVKHETLEAFGAVSKETAIEMADGCRRTFSSDLAVSITGIAGPDGGSDEKPVGTFWIGFSNNKNSFANHFFYPFRRGAVRKAAAYHALDIIRRHILRLPEQESCSEERFVSRRDR